jgi:outer membrane murein-binding lipoprotein Lpp
MKVILVFMVLGLILLSGCSNDIPLEDNSTQPVVSHVQINVPNVYNRVDRLKNPIRNGSDIK